MQEARLQQLAASVRQELRSESLGQLRDVSAMFVQQLTRNRVSHAATQASGSSPPPPSGPVLVVVPEVCQLLFLSLFLLLSIRHQRLQ